MELVKELKTTREWQAESDCTGFASMKKKRNVLKIWELRKEKKWAIMGLIICSHMVQGFRTYFEGGKWNKNKIF